MNAARTVAPARPPSSPSWKRGYGRNRAKLSAKARWRAIDYMLKRWSAFILFLDDGRACLSNNAAERAIRPIAVGRRNWTFAGSDAGGHRAAALYTLIETAKLNGIDAQAWLADVLSVCPTIRPGTSTICCRGTGPNISPGRSLPDTSSGERPRLHRRRTPRPPPRPIKLTPRTASQATRLSRKKKAHSSLY